MTSSGELSTINDLLMKKKSFDWPYDVIRNFSNDFCRMLFTSMCVYKCLYGDVYVGVGLIDAFMEGVSVVCGRCYISTRNNVGTVGYFFRI